MFSLAGIPLKSFPGTFLHGIDLANWYPCWNLCLSGQLYSPDYLAAVDPGVFACHKPIRDTSLDDLEAGKFPQGVYTPRGSWFLQAASQIRSGAHNSWTQNSPSHFSTQEVDRIVKLAKVELAFERGCLQIAPDAPSRLSALYLAEDSDRERQHIRSMLGPNIHILRVTVLLALRVSNADTKWFDEYCSTPDPEFIALYWKDDHNSSGESAWEFLVDGMIQVDDPGGMQRVRERRAKLP